MQMNFASRWGQKDRVYWSDISTDKILIKRTVATGIDVFRKVIESDIGRHAAATAYGKACNTVWGQQHNYQ